MELKGEMSMLNVLHLQDVDMARLQKDLQDKRDEAPQFFIQSPVVVDCSEIAEQCDKLDYKALRELILDLGFIPVGVRGIPEHADSGLLDAIKKGGFALMRAGHAPGTSSTAGESTTQKSEANNASDANKAPDAQASAAPIQSLTIERPVRSGQQVYAANGDMTVLSPTSSGSELVADGSIHVYGALRGRVLAGARGNSDARIFCHSLQAELIAIAGRYQLLDESDTELKGKPAMIRLEGEKLIIEPLN
jgi:septum site-determining protein MinC